MDSKGRVLFLEIDEKNGVVGDYQRTLYAASVLGIDRVLFACIWDEEKNKKRQRGEEIFTKILRTCEILNIDSVPYIISYADRMYENAMIIEEDKYGLMSLSGISGTFENYKSKSTMTDKINKKCMVKTLSEQINNLV